MKSVIFAAVAALSVLALPVQAADTTQYSAADCTEKLANCAKMTDPVAAEACKKDLMDNHGCIPAPAQPNM